MKNNGPQIVVLREQYHERKILIKKNKNKKRCCNISKQNRVYLIKIKDFELSNQFSGWYY